MMLRYKKLLLKKIKKGESEGKIINNSLLKDAKIEIIKMVQAKKKLLQKLGPLWPKNCNSDGVSRLKENSKISQLDPFLDKDGVLRVGGRLSK